MSKIKIEITSSTLSVDDLVEVSLAIVLKQAEMKRSNIPASIIYAAIKSKLSIELEESEFRLALSKSVEAGMIPGISSHLGRSGGFGPAKESSNVSIPNRVVSVPVVAEKVVVSKAVEPVVEKTVALPVNVVAPVARIVEDEDDEDEEEVSIEDLKAIVAAVPTVVTKPEAPKAVVKPIVEIAKTSEPSAVVTEPIDSSWDKEKAKAMILAFAGASSPDIKRYMLMKVNEACESAFKLSQLFRLSMGFDPALIPAEFSTWGDLFATDGQERKTA